MEWAYESVRLYLLCEGMNWSHLPVTGGLYAQHPALLDEWAILFEVKGAHERAKAHQTPPETAPPRIH